MSPSRPWQLPLFLTLAGTLFCIQHALTRAHLLCNMCCHQVHLRPSLESLGSSLGRHLFCLIACLVALLALSHCLLCLIACFVSLLAPQQHNAACHKGLFPHANLLSCFKQEVPQTLGPLGLFAVAHSCRSAPVIPVFFPGTQSSSTTSS